MAEKKDNLFSVIAIGAFNPAILSRKFIEDNCNLTFKGRIEETYTPVLSQIGSDYVNVLVELEKLQVYTHEYDSDKVLLLVKAVLSYLKILKYTPLRALGVNYNYTISGLSIDKLNRNFAADIFEFVFEEVAQVDLFLNQRISKNKKAVLKGARISYKLNNLLSVKYELRILDDNLIINVNFELGELGSERDKVFKFESLLQSIDKYNGKLLNTLQERYDAN